MFLELRGAWVVGDAETIGAAGVLPRWLNMALIEEFRDGTAVIKTGDGGAAKKVTHKATLLEPRRHDGDRQRALFFAAVDTDAATVAARIRALVPASAEVPPIAGV